MITKNHSFYTEIQNELENLNNTGQFRSLKRIDLKDGNYITVKDKKYLNLSSNDYLGLSNDKDLIENFINSLNRHEILNNFGLSSSSSRLLTGHYALYEELENELAKLYGREDALVFNSGYHANGGIISSLVKKGDVIFSDKLNHASIIDGMKLSNAEFYRYNHLDYEHLEKALNLHRKKYKRAVIVSESIFSMDGDRADLRKLVELKDKYDCILMVDEAHAIGVFGKNGCGICEEDKVINDIDIIIGTFGKALASTGAFAVLNTVLKTYFINKTRPFIFTTALAPINIYWSLLIIKLLPSLNSRRNYLCELSNMLRASISGNGLNTLGESQIIPVIVGNNEKTLLVAEKLQSQGLWLLPVRPPTVPQNASRIRISLNSAVKWDEISNISEIISGVQP